jgi:hypothetical protein
MQCFIQGCNSEKYQNETKGVEKTALDIIKSYEENPYQKLIKGFKEDVRLNIETIKLYIDLY